ncbi:MAG: hypothetical protein LBO72_03540 [Helicobacteraceae bacterium]|jgi:Fe-only nitrogenase accessory protein AnfO|nr:hypothetical protein [Helicobacteraceae bacterium]
MNDETPPMKIAALLDSAGVAADLQEGGTIYLFERGKNGERPPSKQLDFSPAKFTSMAELRSYIGFASGQLEDCKILAAKASNGFYRVAFESFGVSLWAVEGAPQDFIGAIEAFYAKPTTLAQNQPPTLITPVPNKAGYYAADLREVMSRKAGLNSKEILLPFFRHTAFTCLELVCDHVPKWFENELPALKLRADAEFADKTVKIRVYPQ